MTDTPGDAALRVVEAARAWVAEHNHLAWEDLGPKAVGQSVKRQIALTVALVEAVEALEANTRHTPEGGAVPVRTQCRFCGHDVTWPGAVLPKPQSGAPDAPPVHCPGCVGEHDDGYDARANCPGIQAAPRALSAEEREALEVAYKFMPSPGEIADDNDARAAAKRLTTIRAFLARTEAK